MFGYSLELDSEWLCLSSKNLRVSFGVSGRVVVNLSSSVSLCSFGMAGVCVD